MADEPAYRNLISSLDIDRDINSIVYFTFSLGDCKIWEFMKDIEEDNDLIELSLVKNRGYRDALILSLNPGNSLWKRLLRDEQKTFSGSKLFYVNQDYSKILVLSVSENLESKLKMVISRLNRINEKIQRENLKIKKENQELSGSKVSSQDPKERLISIVNLNLRA